MKLLQMIRVLSLGALLMIVGSSVPNLVEARSNAVRTKHTPTKHAGVAHASGVRSHALKAFKTPVPDTTKNIYQKLVVKNLGPVINSSEHDYSPTVTADGRTMFFVSRRPGGLGNDDFYMSKSPEGDDTTWGKPVNVAEINTKVEDGAASIAAVAGQAARRLRRADEPLPRGR